LRHVFIEGPLKLCSAGADEKESGSGMNKQSAAKPLPAFAKVIPVMLAEDHMVVREGLKAMLEAEGDNQGDRRSRERPQGG